MSTYGVLPFLSSSVGVPRDAEEVEELERIYLKPGRPGGNLVQFNIQLRKLLYNAGYGGKNLSIRSVPASLLVQAAKLADVDLPRGTVPESTAATASVAVELQRALLPGVPSLAVTPIAAAAPAASSSSSAPASSSTLRKAGLVAAGLAVLAALGAALRRRHS